MTPDIESAQRLHIEVVYALPLQQFCCAMDVAAGTTIRQAIAASGVLTRFPEIDLTINRVGIYARLVTLEQTVCEQDRIEIYRPLLADPKDARRARAAKKKKK